MKMIEDASRLSIQKEMSVRGDEIFPFNPRTTQPPKSNYTQLKRMRLQPALLPKFTENHETTSLPPLVEPNKSSLVKLKTRGINPITSATNLKSANHKLLNNAEHPSHYSMTKRKPTSAIPSLSKTNTGQYRQMYHIPSQLRPGNSKNEVEMNIELVGTSLSLFEPIVRPVRPVIIPKLRTHFWMGMLNIRFINFSKKRSL